MVARRRLDGIGITGLLATTFLFGINQVMIKVVDVGLQPVFFAGVRSLGAVLCIWAWMAWKGRPLRIEPGTFWAGVLVGLVFSAEFLCLFLALDYTTVVRASIIFYSMPLWLSLAAHFWLPGERVTARRAVGLVISFAGVAWAISHRGSGGAGSLGGDLLALGAAIGWAGTAFMARFSAIRRVRPEMQLFWMVAVSGVVLMALSPAFGPLIRDLQPLHLWVLAFQIVVVVSAGFILWLWLLSVYPASTVTSFSFLTPLLSFGFGWLLLGEPVSAQILAAAGLVIAGIVLINSGRRSEA